ncbi:hypothetical protein AHAS_Ahas12G0102900 [Arachis hypogaea]
MKQSVPTGRVQGEFSGSVNKGKEKVVAARLRDEDDGYESEELWDVPISDDEGDPLLRKYPLYKSLKNMKEYKWEVGTLYFLAKIEEPEQKSNSEAEKGLQMLLDSDLLALEVVFLELQKPNWCALNCVGK